MIMKRSKWQFLLGSTLVVLSALFSLAMRTNPFDQEASVEVQ